jgi:uncharacterized protein (TIGR04222 family)
MNSDHQLLWRRLERLPLDAPGTAQPFTARLAREQGWSLRYAVRVVDEYRRFLFLAAAAGPACPSEHVDEAWHLHLCYTRSYWNDLCRDVLDEPLHHQPTEGGPAQLEHHRTMYLATLAAYREQFGSEPPADIWPAVDERFAATFKRSIDLQQHIVLPRPRLAPLVQRLRRRLKPATWLGAFALAPVIGVTWNPLDLPGPEFLWLYGSLLATAIVGGIALRSLLREPDDGSPYPELDAYEVAVLAGDEKLAMQTAICEMIVAGQLALDKADGRLSVVEPHRPHGAPPLVQAIYNGLANREAAGIQDAYNAGQLEAARIGVKLESLRLLETRETSKAARWIPGLLCGGVALLGIAKFFVGVYRDKPVAILAIMAIAAGLAVATFVRPIKRSLRGNHLLRRLQSKRRELDRTDELFTRPPADVAMGIALFGIAAMATAPGGVADLHRWMRPQAAGGTGCSAGGAGCGGEGGGGCGGGGGGGGCGSGCGGCGGD